MKTSRSFGEIEKDDIYIVVGSNSLSKNNPLKKAYSVKNVFAHKGFSFMTAHDDIGLIQLNNKIDFNENVKAIKLPVEKDLKKVNYKAVATGWGTLKVIL